MASIRSRGAASTVRATAATVTLSDNRVAGDALALTYAASFADKNVGTGKAVSLLGGFTLTGSDAANYTLVQPASLVADITPATLTISGLTAINKVYDASTAATLTGTETRRRGATHVVTQACQDYNHFMS